MAYRYYDLRMNVAPLFEVRSDAVTLWRETMHWWPDYAIRLRFVEDGDKYWFILGADSQRAETNYSLYKLLDISDSYLRFKKGCRNEAYLRLGVFSKMYKKDGKQDDMCNCGHELFDHGEHTDDEACLYEDCDCKRFESFVVKLLSKKKTVSDIRFLSERDVKDDALAWNCLNKMKYAKD